LARGPGLAIATASLYRLFAEMVTGMPTVTRVLASTELTVLVWPFTRTVIVAIRGPNFDALKQEGRNLTAAAFHQEIARGVNQLLGRIFAQRRNGSSTDLEAIESALRAVLHQTGAGALSELLQFGAPARISVSCPALVVIRRNTRNDALGLCSP
jgi:hypothetical protein